MIEKIISLLDLTSLNDTDDASVIARLCDNAKTADGQVAAVCVYPQFVKQVANYFSGTSVNVATVANFPQGNDVIEAVIRSIRQSIDDGAQEIDVVFPYQKYLVGEEQSASDFIHACRQACGKEVLLKVILETGVLQEAAIIEKVSRVVLLAGTDFLKTSTGKVAIGATPEAAKVMLQVIKEMTGKLKRPLGLKVSGGVRTQEQALQYIELASQIMGSEWVCKQHFRIGASRIPF